jgi:hypothetical protein
MTGVGEKINLTHRVHIRAQSQPDGRIPDRERCFRRRARAILVAECIGFEFTIAILVEADVKPSMLNLLEHGQQSSLREPIELVPEHFEDALFINMSQVQLKR